MKSAATDSRQEKKHLKYFPTEICYIGNLYLPLQQHYRGTVFAAQRIPANSHTAGAGYDDRNTASAAMSGDKGEQEEKAEREEEKGEIIKEHNKK
ncbi:MAG TPA: hypothetical protein H9927_01070, partial [Candidatus Alistipes merdipullorum]|nr:hypothetical protein [Candidatus Alistipes merdipullorum]